MVNKDTLTLIKQFEGLRLKAYPDPGSGGEPYTIGYGTTVYPDGKKVKLGDVITLEQASQFLTYDINRFSVKVALLIKSAINENQFGALVSFAYNVGLENLKISTLLKKVNKNPSDPTIADEFAKWKKAAGRVLPGLVRRRAEETKLYFK